MWRSAKPRSTIRFNPNLRTIRKRKIKRRKLRNYKPVLFNSSKIKAEGENRDKVKDMNKNSERVEAISEKGMLDIKSPGAFLTIIIIKR